MVFFLFHYCFLDCRTNKKSLTHLFFSPYFIQRTQCFLYSPAHVFPHWPQSNFHTTIQSKVSTMAIEIIEQNEVNQPTATYVYTESNDRGRFDLIVGTPSSAHASTTVPHTDMENSHRQVHRHHGIKPKSWISSWMSFYQRGIRIVSARIIFRGFFLACAALLLVLCTNRFRYQIFVSTISNRHVQIKHDNDSKRTPCKHSAAR